MTDSKNKGFDLGGITVCPGQNTLSYAGKNIKTQPRVMDVLCYLAKNEDRVVSIGELIDTLWGGAVVSNHAVQRCISNIRKHLTELLGEGEYVTSYSKKGYQLRLKKEAAPFTPNQTTVPTERSQSKNGSQHLKALVKGKLSLIFLASFVIVALGVYLVRNSSTNDAGISYESLTPLTFEQGLEYSPEPHPDNQHFAFAKYRNQHFELLVTKAFDDEWTIATDKGRWNQLTWSPDGTKLVASAANYASAGTSLDIYLFELDLTNHSVINTKLLMPWQGDLYSITWRNNITLELTGHYGVRGERTRFSYSIDSEDLRVIPREGHSKAPHIVDVLGGKTALASYQESGFTIDFFDAKGRLISNHNIDAQQLDMSWRPDGSGVLLLMDQKLFSLDIKGTPQSIPFISDKSIHKPRFGSDGKSILLTQISENSDIWLESISGGIRKLTKHAQNDSFAQFDQAGELIYYLSKRGGIVQLYKIDNDESIAVTKAIDGSDILYFILSDDQQNLLYKTSKGIYSYSLRSGSHTLLIEGSTDIYPVAYRSESGLIYYANREIENSNIWQLNTETNTKKQITFGTVYSAVLIDGHLYFQYFNRSGLYRLGVDNRIPTLVTDTLPVNAIYTLIDAKGLYFMTMEYQNQSDIHYLDFDSAQHEIFLRRDESQGIATGFHPDIGVLMSLDTEQNGNIYRLH